MRIKTLLLSGLLAILPGLLQASAELTLNVTLEGGKPGEGEFVVGLFDAEDAWLKDVVREIRVPVSEDGTAEISFEALPAGTYAISTYQDRNLNGKIDTNFVGIPKEPYAFSNEARGMFGPAKFKDAAFELVESDETVAIRYP